MPSTPASAKTGNQQNRKSAANAKAAFKNFTLSRISKAEPRRVYVKKGEKLAVRQKALIKSQLAALGPSSPGLTLILSDEKALNMKDGKIDLTVLIDAMEKARQGTEFYTSGTRLREQIDNQKHVEDFFSALTGGKGAKAQ